MTDSADSSSQEDQLDAFDKLWNFNQPEETEAQFRKLLSAAEKAPDSSIRLQLLTQIARCQGLQRSIDQAHATLDEVEKQLSAAPPLVSVRYLLERGRVFNSSNHKDQARPLFLQAWEVGKQADLDNFAIDAAHMLGIIEPPHEALDWNEKALALAESSQDLKARSWLGSLYNNIGWTYHDAGQFDQAMTLFKKGLAFREKQGDAQTIRVARWCVARCHRSVGQVEKALEMQIALLNEFEKAGQSDGYVSEELGECYLILKQPAQAKPHFAAAYAELSKDLWLKENEPKRLERLRQLGEVTE